MERNRLEPGTMQEYDIAGYHVVEVYDTQGNYSIIKSNTSHLQISRNGEIIYDNLAAMQFAEESKQKITDSKNQLQLGLQKLNNIVAQYNF